MTLALDASSLLAFLYDEPGDDRVWSVLSGAMVCAMNWLEVCRNPCAVRLRSPG